MGESRRFHAAGIIALAIFMASCGGGGGSGGGDSYPPATSTSFSPLQASDTNGASAAIFWRYVANGGEPFEVETDGGTLRLRLSEYQVTRDPEDSLLRSSSRGTVSGTIRRVPVSGSAQSSDSQEYTRGAQTRIVATTSASQTSLSGSGVSTTVRLNLETRYVPSYLYLLDSPDLDELPVGYTSQDQVWATVRISGTRTTNGQTEALRFNDLAISGPVTWRVTAKMDRATVQGREYRNVVVVDHETWKPSSTLTTLDRSALTYWVAKGIGVIHVESFLDFGSREPVLSELVATNLVAPDMTP